MQGNDPPSSKLQAIARNRQNRQVAQLQGLAILINTSDDFISRSRMYQVRDGRPGE
jgi:hypothetical protein